VNLKRWGQAYGKRGTLKHALSSCKKSLTQGRYTWCQVKFLKVFAEIIGLERRLRRANGKRNMSYILKVSLKCKGNKEAGMIAEYVDSKRWV
jgi:hypothetical protein